MDKQKQKKLEDAGWKVGSTEDFLGESQKRKDKVKEYLDLRKKYLDKVCVDKYCDPELESRVIAEFIDSRAKELFPIVKRRALEVIRGMADTSKEVRERIRIKDWWFEGRNTIVARLDDSFMGDMIVWNKKINMRALLR
jgi:hypothetical protein